MQHMFAIAPDELKTTAFMLRVRTTAAIEHEVHHQLGELSAHLDRLSQFAENTATTAIGEPTPAVFREDITETSPHIEAILSASEGEENEYILIPSVL